MKCSIFWDITPRSPLKVNRRLGGKFASIFRIGEKDKEESSMKQNSACCLLNIGFLLVLFFNPEDGGDISLRNVGLLSTDYAALYPRRQNSSHHPLREHQNLHILDVGSQQTTPRNILLLVKLTVTKVVNKLPVFYENRKLISVFINSRF
jgi:hypothetical protein